MARKQKTYAVKPGPRRYQEDPVFYYEYVSEFFDIHFGFSPVRYSLYKYMTGGYPIAKGGDRVAMPIYISAKRPMTTKQSMCRWLTIVRKLERKHEARQLCAA